MEIQKEQFDSLLKMVTEIGSSVEKMKDCLLGNEYNGIGLVKEVIDIESRVEKLEKKIEGVQNKAVGFGIGSGISIAGIVEWLRHLITG